MWKNWTPVLFMPNQKEGKLKTRQQAVELDEANREATDQTVNFEDLETDEDEALDNTPKTIDGRDEFSK